MYLHWIKSISNIKSILFVHGCNLRSDMLPPLQVSSTTKPDPYINTLLTSALAEQDEQYCNKSTSDDQ